MSDTNTPFIRKYKRQSKSPWENDSSTILLYADVVSSDKNEVELGYTNYIYLHRDDVGRVLGISISKTMLEDNPDFASRYLEDIHAYCFLLIHIEKIANFCCLFTEEFESIFLLEPRAYFATAESRWFNIIENA
jgi:hypothetical protein